MLVVSPLHGKKCVIKGCNVIWFHNFVIGINYIIKVNTRIFPMHFMVTDLNHFGTHNVILKLVV